MESLEHRELLAADLAVTEFASDGEDLVIDYVVNNQNASTFAIGIYKSADGVTPQSQLQTVQVTSSADYSQGSHTLTITPSFSDSSDDYYLVVVMDIYDNVNESNETNNNEGFEGGVFLTNDGVIQVHGSDAADSVNVDGGSSIDITYNGASESYAPAIITGVHVRSHDGNDTVNAVTAGLLDIQAHAGDGDDILIGGRGDDSFDGGDGDDVMLGRSGDDTLDGGSGNDEIGGGHGDDSIFGGDGHDMLHGDAGEDLIYGEDGSDVIYGGDAADEIFAGDGDDYVFATADDTVSLGNGNDTLYEDEDGNNGYGSAYGSRPVISDLGIQYVGGLWVIVGSVSDPDEDPTGLTVTIGGLVDDSGTVAYDDTFAVVVEPSEEQTGWICATVTDTDGNESEVVWLLVG